MLFNSLQFVIFFPIVTWLYFVLPHRYRWFMLLTASCIFYMAFIPVYILILVVTIVIDYVAGILIENSTGKRRKLLLLLSILSTCAVLFIFKYYNFFVTNYNAIAHFFDLNYSIEVISLILPIGLSFHTFQSLSYVIEVYRGRQKAERHFGIYSLYVMFYPQLVAGPIERPQNLLHQFREKHEFDYSRVVSGLQLMAWGLFKKIVIADRLAIFVNQVYANPSQFDGVMLTLATVFFAFQIYCDFSGYSDIAIGAAQVMGFRLMSNFHRPYYSKSISEFWKRWHISLSTWFKDYVYISLGGNRVAKWRWQFNLFLTFLLSGLWHGANWTYVVWGGLNGFYLVFSIWVSEVRGFLARQLPVPGGHQPSEAGRKFDRPSPWWTKLRKVVLTFGLICFSWIFFRAHNIDDAWYIVTHLFSGYDRILDPGYWSAKVGASGLGYPYFILSLGLILAMEGVHLLQRHRSIRSLVTARPLVVRWGIYFLWIISIMLLGVFQASGFIYFQF